MSEIEKLKKRLKNVGKNVTTYNMTVAEAWALIEEFEKQQKQANEKLAELTANLERWKSFHQPQAPIVRNIDGGTF